MTDEQMKKKAFVRSNIFFLKIMFKNKLNISLCCKLILNCIVSDNISCGKILKER